MWDLVGDGGDDKSLKAIQYKSSILYKKKEAGTETQNKKKKGPTPKPKGAKAGTYTELHGCQF